MSKTNVAGTGRDSGRSWPAGLDHGVVRSSGHSFVSLLGLSTSDTASLRERIREGLTYESWDRFLESTGLPKEAVIQVVQMTPRTLARRKCEGREPLDERRHCRRVCRGDPVAGRSRSVGPSSDKRSARWLRHVQRRFRRPIGRGSEHGDHAKQLARLSSPVGAPGSGRRMGSPVFLGHAARAQRHHPTRAHHRNQPGAQSFCAAPHHGPDVPQCRPACFPTAEVKPDRRLQRRPMPAHAKPNDNTTSKSQPPRYAHDNVPIATVFPNAQPSRSNPIRISLYIQDAL
jgi:hypothetical protein